MAFAYAVTKSMVKGNRKHVYGTFTNGSTDSGGTIAALPKFVETFSATCNSHLGTEVLKVTKNSPSAGSIAIVTSDGADGDWEASGL